MNLSHVLPVCLLVLGGTAFFLTPRVRQWWWSSERQRRRRLVEQFREAKAAAAAPRPISEPSDSQSARDARMGVRCAQTLTEAMAGTGLGLSAVAIAFDPAVVGDLDGVGRPALFVGRNPPGSGWVGPTSPADVARVEAERRVGELVGNGLMTEAQARTFLGFGDDPVCRPVSET